MLIGRGRVNRGETIDISFNDHGAAGQNNTSLLYEPNISKPIRAKRQVTITLNNGKLEGIPKAWREVLDMPEQEKEIEEIDEILEVSRRKLKRIDSTPYQSNIVFELT
jgi:hypothetical protein